MRAARFALLLLAPAAASCALAPGMQMDAAAAERRAMKAKPGQPEDRYKVQPITSQLVAQLVAERRWAWGSSAPDPLAAEAERYQYRVAPFDILSVIVWGHPELTMPAGEFRSPESTGNLVAADGTIFYPYVGTVRVAGRTVQEIRHVLAERLSAYVKNPQLEVRVIAFRGQKVYVTGEVAAPGIYYITDVPMRVQDAIAQARGPGPEADLQHVTVTRLGAVYQLNLLALYEVGDSSQNWLLRDGDIVHVPDRNVYNKVFVLGEVRSPRAQVMPKGRLSLAEALGDQGGIDPLTGNPASIYVLRGHYEIPTIYHLDASSPDAFLLATQFPLLPRDVVFVSTYGIARLNRVLSQILPTVNAIWATYDVLLRSGAVRPFR